MNEINEIYRIVKNFLKTQENYNKSENLQVKIFYLQLKKEEQIESVPNPEFESWIEIRKMIDQNDVPSERNNQNHKNDKNDKIIQNKINFNIDMDMQKIPPKTIEKIAILKKIETKQLNEIEKHIDTLYLRQKDKDKLISSLFQFRNKKNILKSFGIQNKLNILLYGLPGTGKSSTIQAVATYLQRDIYYIDLKNAETNEDLQFIFEYVNNNVQNGGIIVLEDIDAMTNIVLQRKFVDNSNNSLVNKSREISINDLVNSENNKLSLEYLLNILQGTLTIDISIFIVTTNHFDKLDPAFYRSGRFDVKIELKLCDHFQIMSIYKKMFNRDINKELLSKIKEDKYSPADVIYHLKDYIFCDNVSDEEILKQFIEN